MKKIQKLICVITIMCAYPLMSVSAPTNANVYVRKSGKNIMYQLVLTENQTFTYIKKSKSKSYTEKGTYTQKGKKIILTPIEKSRGFGGLGDYVLYLHKEKIYAKKTDIIFNKVPLFTSSNEPYTSDDNSNTTRIESSSHQGNNSSGPVDLKHSAMSTQNYYKRLCKNYVPQYLALIDSFYAGPDTYKTYINNQHIEWNGDTSHNVLLSNFNTVIHESLHHYNRYSSNGDYIYMIKPGEFIRVKITKTFQSERFKKLVPNDAEKNIFRYKTYVSEGAVVSANVVGIYGLMDEFIAYGYGTRSSMDLGNKLLEMNQDTASAITLYKQSLATGFAQYEFNLFMAWYLHYASVYEKEIYESLMNNRPLRYLYYTVNREFEATNRQLSILSQKYDSELGYINRYYTEKYTEYPKILLEKEQSYLDRFILKEKP